MIPKSVEIDSSVNIQSCPATASLDETTWRAWLERNHADEMRGAERHMRLVKWASIGLLLTVATLWTLVGPYQVGMTFAIALCAFAIAFSALREHRYVVAAGFAALVLIYNPLFPTFSLAGRWQRLVVLASVAPFVASLVWQRPVTSVPVSLRHVN